MSDHDPLDAAKKFDDAVRATSVVGGLVVKVDTIDKRTERIEVKVDRVVHTMDRYAGAMVVVGSLISIAVSLIVAVIKSDLIK